MISALVLAAGRATRMGQPKQLLRIAGETLVHRAARTALSAGVDDVVVVVGNAAEEVCADLADLPLRTILNPDYADGMATSLRAGVRALAADSEAVVVLLADQPLLESRIVAALVERFRRSDAPLVVPLYAGRRGNPVLFARALYGELAQVSGDAGARELVAAHLAEAAQVELDEPAAQMDVDTWEEYEWVKALVEGSGE